MSLKILHFCPHFDSFLLTRVICVPDMDVGDLSLCCHNMQYTKCIIICIFEMFLRLYVTCLCAYISLCYVTFLRCFFKKCSEIRDQFYHRLYSLNALLSTSFHSLCLTGVQKLCNNEINMIAICCHTK
jgi:hypothetical protein